MITNLIVGLGIALMATIGGSNSAPTAPEGTNDVYGFSLKTIDGKALDLSKYKGKKLLLVNVASKCGYTPQYAKLQQLHEKYGNKLVIIGFPANNFGGQEPGSNAEVKEFCTKNYGVSFLMAEKISVKGSDVHPLYKFLAEKTEAPSWNFCKYLINEKGEVVKFFKSSVDPLSDEIVKGL